MKRAASRYKTVGSAAVGVVSGVVDAVIGVVVAAVSRVVRQRRVGRQRRR